MPEDGRAADSGIGADHGPRSSTVDFEAEDGGLWTVRRFSLAERLSGLYSCDVELTHAGAEDDVEALLGSSCAVTLSRGGGVERRVCGIIHQASRLGGLDGRVVVRAQIVPALWGLGHSINARIFQNLTVPQILEQVLNEGLEPYERSVRLDLRRASYAEREYCVQYRETDFAFVQRLMHEEGIGFYFDHEGDAEAMVLFDGNDVLPACETATGSTIDLVPIGAGAPDHEVVHALAPTQRLGSTSVVLHEYDWTRPSRPAHHEVHGADAAQRERIVYDGAPALCLGAQGDDGAARKQIRAEELSLAGWRGEGTGNVLSFAPGRRFTLQSLEASDLDREYLVVQVTHEGTAPDEWSGEVDDKTEYHNAFVCMPADVPYRPQRSSERPTLVMQTATVAGPTREEVYTDEHGRIKVQFHWDREGQSNEQSSCWLRVAQLWAGQGYGMIFLPRVGMEVVVQFVDGNPDRPLVVGTVYNGHNLVPYELPGEKTRSGLRTSSSPGGSGYNELYFEDAAGNEEVYLRAERDLNVLVQRNEDETVRGDNTRTVYGNDQHTIQGHHRETIAITDQVSVGGARSLSVGAAYTRSVGGMEKTAVGGQRSVEVGGDVRESTAGEHGESVGKGYSLTVGKDMSVSVGGKRTLDVSGDSTESVGKNLKLAVAKDAHLVIDKNLSIKVAAEIKVQADKAITVTCGSAKLTLKSDGKVHIQGSDIEIKGSGNVKVTGSKIGEN